MRSTMQPAVLGPHSAAWLIRMHHAHSAADHLPMLCSSSVYMSARLIPLVKMQLPVCPAMQSKRCFCQAQGGPQAYLLCFTPAAGGSAG